ncbi:MAG: hypothetical protein C7B45_02080 [Sulfobacillus acidophilus]|uniref:Uncharacterized protein n=1 Tax=Sulfobacillus acidophilus TaxID=53633 RepID=A0A2T2WNN7_9FIRM|nr:MAG: hypothetical protein C7B45_02080 [Sulfobacillus acidophilus]
MSKKRFPPDLSAPAFLPTAKAAGFSRVFGEAEGALVGQGRRHGVELIEMLVHDRSSRLWRDTDNFRDWGLENVHPVGLMPTGAGLIAWAGGMADRWSRHRARKWGTRCA